MMGAIDTHSGASDMDQLLTLFIAISGLTGLALGALRWGADSRDRLPDDHRR